MAASISAAATGLGTRRPGWDRALSARATPLRTFGCFFDPLRDRVGKGTPAVSLRTRKKTVAVCSVLAEDGKPLAVDGADAAVAENGAAAAASSGDDVTLGTSAARATERRAIRKKAERSMYLVAAVLSSFGITSIAIAAVYYRFFSWQVEGGEVPLSEMAGTFALSVGAAVGIEFWARWAHRSLWHASLWHMHESHHRPRDGPFELNDVFAVVNAIPAVSLLSYGLLRRGLFPGLCFGAGLGITLFGVAYMFVHDGLVHRRFPVGPVAGVPYLRRVAAAHLIHHAGKFEGVPYGLFLGPKELEEVGGLEELEKEINRMAKLGSTSSGGSEKMIISRS